MFPLFSTDIDFFSDQHKEMVNITSDDVSKCLKRNASMLVRAENVRVQYFDEGAPGFKLIDDKICTLRFVAPPGKSWIIRDRTVGKPCRIRVNRFKRTISDHGHKRTLRMWNCDLSFYMLTHHPLYALSAGENVTLHMKVTNILKNYSMDMNFTAVSAVETVFFGSKQGHIQTPWDILPNMNIVMYPAIDEDILLAAPRAHIIMISFSMYSSHTRDCEVDQVQLHKVDNSSNTLLKELCTMETGEMVFTVNISALRVAFVARGVPWKHSGFEIKFSFHESSVTPQRLPSGQWNCSVPHWSEFQQHLQCNLDTECVGGEDELECPFTGHCGPHRLTIRERCYDYVAPGYEVSWYEAQVQCNTRGAYLASLNTPRELNDVMHVLSYRRSAAVTFLGLKYADINLPNMYSHTTQWADSSIAYYVWYYEVPQMYRRCAINRRVTDPLILDAHDCSKKAEAHFLCEAQYKGTAEPLSKSAGIRLAEMTSGDSLAISHVTCPKGHLTHSYFACDTQSACWAEEYGVLDQQGIPSRTWCPVSLTSLPPSFTCANDVQHVPYTLVCDHRNDCHDASDEDFCAFQPCASEGVIPCSSSTQCTNVDEQCDGQNHCSDVSDEDTCDNSDYFVFTGIQRRPAPLRPPAIIDFLPSEKYKHTPERPSAAGYTVSPVQYDDQGEAQCPHTHFQCPDDGYCLPVYVRCNGVTDCPGAEDEEDCDTYSCPGFFRCRDSKVCLHVTHVCDTILHCPQRDDELVCDLRCPPNCTCHGLAFTCRGAFPASDYPALRYLDVSGTVFSPFQLVKTKMIVYLNLAGCGILSAEMPSFPNLYLLNLGNNFITAISEKELGRWQNLRTLRLSGNPFESNVFTNLSTNFEKLEHLDISHVNFRQLNTTTMKHLTHLRKLNLSNSGIRNLVDGFQALSKLGTLDLRKSVINSYPRNILKGLTLLSKVYSENYKFCCPAILPEIFNSNNCMAPLDTVSSCDNLVKWKLASVVLSILAAISLIGNNVWFTFRVVLQKVYIRSCEDVWMLHLTVCDFLMGVYLTVVIVADRIYEGSYVWYDVAWRHSAFCSMSGFLFMLSASVSSLLICLLTLRSFLSLYRKALSVLFTARVSHLLSGVVWLCGTVLSSVPLWSVFSHWQIFSRSALCMPMPVLTVDSPGHSYIFGSLVVYNFTLSSLSCAVHVFVCHALSSYPVTAEDPVGASPSLSSARRLLWMTGSHHVFRLSVALTELWAYHGTAVSTEMRVVMAMVLLPGSAAINPVLYALGVVMERKRAEEKDRLVRQLKAKIAGKQHQTKK